MCGRFTITNERELIENRFGARFDAIFFAPRYNAAPSQSQAVILNTEPQVIQPLVWGLRPKWLKQVARREGLINVRVSGWIDDSEYCSRFRLEIQQTRPHLHKPANSF